MIKVQRSIEPVCLQQHAGEWLIAYLAAKQAWENAATKEEKKQLKSQKDNAENKYSQNEVRTALKNMFHKKCAFCESRIDHISYPHIEHFFPKESNPNLCFNWNNLLLACGVCNGAEYKGTKFPLTDDGDPMVNPCNDDPNDFFDFKFEEEKNSEFGFISVVRPKNARGQITEETLGLNRVPLLRHRCEKFLPYYPFIAQKAKDGDEKAKQILARACNPKFEFSAFARALWREFLEIDI